MMTNTMNDRRDALARIIAAHNDDRELALAAIADYCDDPAAISSPALLAALDDFFDGETFPDTTLAHETLDEFDRDAATIFAAQNDLCNDHSCDPDNCADQH